MWSRLTGGVLEGARQRSLGSATTHLAHGTGSSGQAFVVHASASGACAADHDVVERMHSTLTEHARCLYGDEYRPTPACGQEHREHHFVEEPTFADADALLSMLRELCPDLVDG